MHLNFLICLHVFSSQEISSTPLMVMFYIKEGIFIIRYGTHSLDSTPILYLVMEVIFQELKCFLCSKSFYFSTLTIFKVKSLIQKYYSCAKYNARLYVITYKILFLRSNVLDVLNDIFINLCINYMRQTLFGLISFNIWRNANRSVFGKNAIMLISMNSFSRQRRIKHFKEYNFQNVLWGKLFFRVVDSKDVLLHFSSKEFNFRSFLWQWKEDCVLTHFVQNNNKLELNYLYCLLSFSFFYKILGYSFQQRKIKSVSKKFRITWKFEEMILGNILNKNFLYLCKRLFFQEGY